MGSWFQPTADDGEAESSAVSGMFSSVSGIFGAMDAANGESGADETKESSSIFGSVSDMFSSTQEDLKEDPTTRCLANTENFSEI